MDIRLRAESLRPVRYLLNYRQRERPAVLAGSRAPAGGPGAADALSWRQAARSAAAAGGGRIAIVGLGCRFPDADDPVALLDVVLTGRRAFRRLPPTRLDLADYYSADRAAADATYSTRAALIEGWRFDREAFGVPEALYRVVDPAQWLALETAARALAAAGFAHGEGLARNRTGVIIGNSLGGDGSRAAALRLRWPYVRRVFADALAAGGIPPEYALPVLGHAKQRYLEPFPATTDETLAGATPAGIAARICRHFGFRGGGYAVDGSQASSLLAVASACSALAAGELDVALAGGVDIGLDPLEIVGLAKTGVLARGEMRVYDENPTGYLPGEGCGMVVLMRSVDARAAGLPVYAEIAGWGTSSSAGAGPDSRSQFLALHRAYQRARIAPGDVQYIEGHGAGTAASDATELSALAELRADAAQVAALGSVKANIGNTKAAAGAAGLIKTVLAMSTGYIPPATGFSRPHPLLRSGDAVLRLPRAPEPWPEGPRTAGVSAMGPGMDVHLVLHSEPIRGRHERRQRGAAGSPRTGTSPAAVASSAPLIGGPSRTLAYLLHAPDRGTLVKLLARVAHVTPWLSDAELGDLACQLARDASSQGPARVALVASSQDHLARVASQAAALLPRLPDELLTLRPGIYAADGADGRVTLLLSGADGKPGPGSTPDRPGSTPDRHGSTADRRSGLLWLLSSLQWLDKAGVTASAAVGYGDGEIAGLVWAGCLSEPEALAFTAIRTRILAPQFVPDALAQPDDGRGPSDRTGLLHAAIEQLTVSPARRRLMSAALGREIAAPGDIADLLRRNGPPSGLEAALRAGAVGATVLLETGPGRDLTKAATAVCGVPAISLASGSGADVAHAAGALFAAGALGSPAEVFAGRPSRPFDLWRERTFITSPAEAAALTSGLVEHAMVPAPRPTPLPARPAAAALPPGSAPPPPGSAPSADRALPPALPSDPGAALRRIPAQRRAPAQPGPEYEPGSAATPATAPATADSVPAAPDGAPAAPDRTPTADDPVPPADKAPAAAEKAATATVWVRCYAEKLRTAGDVSPTQDDGPWRVRSATEKSFGIGVQRLFRDDPAAVRELVVAGDPSQPSCAAAAVVAARDAISSGTLVLVTHSDGFGGFGASLHAEHPELGITVLRVPPSAEGLRLARRFAAAEPGRFRELVVDAAGVRDAVMVPVATPGSGASPLGPGDVVLVSRSGTGADVALAQVLGACGAAVGIVGPARPDDEPGVVAELERLGAAGARIGVEDTDVAGQDDLTAALRRIEARFGPVTALAATAGQAAQRPVGELTSKEAHDYVAGQTAALSRLADAVRSEADRSDGDGQPRELRLIVTFGSAAGRYGLARAGLAALGGSALAGAAARLAAGFSGCRALHVDWPDCPDWSGAQAGFGEGSRLLFDALATPGIASRIAVHGRVGETVPPAIAAAAGSLPRGRFLEEVRVHYPGVELVCDARLSKGSDPYLSDYRLYGMPVLPATMALEAMAQVASALAGRPLRQLTAVSMDAPVVVPARQLIRMRAVWDGPAVTVALRCEESGFGTDHFRATFSLADELSGAPVESLASLPELEELPVGGSGSVDAALLYGPVCFQSGRFRRAALLPDVTSRSCRALVRDAEDGQPWFGERLPATSADAGLLLGSPGLTDATWHVLQACVPHRRLLPAGCDCAVFSGREADGQVEIRAAQTSRDSWDVQAVDASGQPLVTWRGLRLADAGPLARTAPWPLSLLPAYLESRAAALGLDPDLRVTVHAGQGSEGFALSAHARHGVSCGWAIAGPEAGPGAGADGPDLAGLEAELRRRGEPPGAVAAMLRAVCACLAEAGQAPAPPVPVPPLLAPVASNDAEAGWLVLRAGEGTLACTVTEVSGVCGPVAIAIMTWASMSPSVKSL